MSEEASAAPAATPAPAVVPAVVDATTAAKPAAPAPKDDDQNPTWLPSRLKQARQSERAEMLKEFGATDLADLKAKLKRLDELETEQLSEKERYEKRIKELSAYEETAPKLAKTLAEVIDAQFEALPENVREAIDAKANGDPSARWDQIQTFKRAGFLDAAAAPSKPKAAQTVPGGATPPPQPATPQTPYDKWVELQKTDSVGASIFYQHNAMAIDRSRSS